MFQTTNQEWKSKIHGPNHQAYENMKIYPSFTPKWNCGTKQVDTSNPLSYSKDPSDFATSGNDWQFAIENGHVNHREPLETIGKP